jgi:ankyrin repeat protein
MSKQLPSRPNLEHLREQAKDLLKAYRSGDPEATSLFPNDQHVALHDAQFLIAREYGFKSWPALVEHVESIRAQEGITEDVVKTFVDRAASDDLGKLRRLMELYPTLPTHGPVCALMCGEEDYVGNWLTPERLTEPIGPMKATPLNYVCYSRVGNAYPERKAGLFACAKLLLNAGADPNSYITWEGDPNARLPVLYGATGAVGDIDIARILLERGAHPNDGESVYHSAQFNRREILDLLLEYGADISGKDAHIANQPEGHKWNNTPMFFLLGHRPSDPGMTVAAEGIKWLLQHGADPNVPCYEPEETALHAACRGGWNGEMVEELLRHGAEPMIKRKDGRTAYELACLTGNREAARVLEMAGAKVPLQEKDRFVAACAAGDEAEAARIKSEAPNLTENLSEEARTAFVKLAEYGVIHGIRTMIKAGVSPGIRGCMGHTPLHFASFCGRKDVVDVLLEAGAPVDAIDDEHKATPLGWATFGASHVRSPQGDYPAVIRSLVAAGGSQEELREFLDRENSPADIVLALKGG